MNKDLEKIREEIIKIIEQSHLGCTLPKECNTECGECGADRLLPFLASKGVAIQTPGGLSLLSDLMKEQ